MKLLGARLAVVFARVSMIFVPVTNISYDIAIHSISLEILYLQFILRKVMNKIILVYLLTLFSFGEDSFLSKLREVDFLEACGVDITLGLILPWPQ